MIQELSMLLKLIVQMAGRLAHSWASCLTDTHLTTSSLKQTKNSGKSQNNTPNQGNSMVTSATLKRLHYLSTGIFGTMAVTTSDDKVHTYATAEHAYETSSGTWAPKMIAGRYTLKRGTHKLEDSPKPFEAYEFLNVPEHTDILIHVGNMPQIDSMGCVLIGMGLSLDSVPNMIYQSKIAFNDFMEATSDEESFEIVVS